MNFPRQSKGFTLVEILVGVGISVLLVGIVTLLLVQFKKSYSKGEESTIIIQEGGMFLAMLRNDMINAVMDKTLNPDQWKESIRAEPEAISFPIYRDAEGTIEPVIYAVEKNPKKSEGLSISRSQGGGSAKMLVDGHLASLTWTVGTDLLPGVGSGVRQIWLNIDLVLGGQGVPGLKGKILRVSTKLFPTRLNRQINRF